MPTKYTTSSDEDESDYEDEEGFHFTPDGEDNKLGEGFYSIARRFKSESDIGKTRKKAVLSPTKSLNWDADEVDRKIRFFNTLYPNEKAAQFSQQQRLIVPYIEGNSYTHKTVLEGLNTVEGQIKLFQSASQEIKLANDHGLVILDLHIDNILYNATEEKSYLIDGGLSHEIGEPILKGQQETPEVIMFLKDKYQYLAPECFTLKSEVAALAHPSMDVYSLGCMMRYIIPRNMIDEDINKLLIECTAENPNNRPKIEDVIDRLAVLQVKTNILRSSVFNFSEKHKLEKTLKINKTEQQVVTNDITTKIKATLQLSKKGIEDELVKPVSPAETRTLYNKK